MSFALEYTSPVREHRNNDALRRRMAALREEVDDLETEAEDLRDKARNLENDARKVKREIEAIESRCVAVDDVVTTFGERLLNGCRWLSGAAREAIENVLAGDGQVRRLMELAQNYGWPWPQELLELARLQQRRTV